MKRIKFFDIPNKFANVPPDITLEFHNSIDLENFKQLIELDENVFKFGGQYFWGSNSYMVDDIAYIAKVAVANFDIDGLIYNGNRIF